VSAADRLTVLVVVVAFCAGPFVLYGLERWADRRRSRHLDRLTPEAREQLRRWSA
jgi:hypothetical protein